MVNVQHHVTKPHYLVCVNGEGYSEVALKFAGYLAHRNGGYVSILHVIETKDFQTIGKVAEKMRREMLDAAEVLLTHLSELCYETVEITPSVLIREGLIEAEIIKVIEEDRSINMLLVGAAPEATIRSKILPPLVSESGKRLQIPIMVVPGNLTENQIANLT